MEWWSARGGVPADSAYALIVEVVGEAAPGIESTADPRTRTVTLFVPVPEVESYLAGQASGCLERIRGCVWRLERERQPVRLSIASELSVGPEPRLLVRLMPE